MKQVILALSLVFLSAAVIVTQHIEKKVTRFELPQGELKWSNVNPKNGKMCIPAAFSSTKNTIVGVHRIDGKSYGNDHCCPVKVPDDYYKV